MAKAKKSPARKTAPPRPSAAPLIPSLPPEALEQAAQGWLKSSGAPSLPLPKNSWDGAAQQLTKSLGQTLHSLQTELHHLGERIRRLEEKSR